MGFVQPDLDWQERAACIGMFPTRPGQPDIFFPERGQAHLVEAARAICAACPVFYQCRDWHETTDSRYGVWAAELASKKG